MSYFENIDIQAADSPSIDAFGRWRVSQLTTLFDTKYLHDDQPLLIDEEIGGTGSSSHSTITSSVNITTSANNDYVVRQSFQRTPYQNGKSHLLLFTFSDFQSQTNITKRVGYFSSSSVAPYTASQDGIYLETDGTDHFIKVYRLATEVHSFASSTWHDPLDGTGASGVTIDWEKTNIFGIDFEWLGVGRIRFYVVINGLYVQFHEINNANDQDNVYMSSPNQPLRWEIRQTGAGSGSFSTICSTASSEGGLNQIGKILSDNASDNDLQFNSSGTTYAGIGIRLKTTHLDQVIDILNFKYLAETNDRALWELRLNPTVTGTFTYTDVANAAVQTSIGNQTGGAAPTVTGGTVLDSGYVQQQGTIDANIQSAIKLGTAIDGTRDEIVLCITPIQAGLDAFVSYTWRELT